MEYWENIEGFGGFIRSMNYVLDHDRTGGVDGDISDARKISRRLVFKLECLVSELGEKFGVIHPKDCPRVEFGQGRSPAPEGKVYYWDWYKRMKELTYRLKYEKIICSACPLSRGVEDIIRLGVWIPCGVFDGILPSMILPYQYQCGMTDTFGWRSEELHQKILEKDGEVAFLQFRIKEAGLKAMAETTMQKSSTD